MFTTIIAAASVGAGAWTYSGILAERGPKPEPTPPAAVVAPPAPPPAIARPAEVAAKQAAPSPVPPPVPPPPPTIWRLADATGQVWEHTDPAQLSAFVADRNRWFAHPAYSAPAPPAYQARGRCGPSGCPR